MNNDEQSLLKLAAELHDGLRDMQMRGWLGPEILDVDSVWLDNKLAAMAELLQRVKIERTNFR